MSREINQTLLSQVLQRVIQCTLKSWIDSYTGNNNNILEDICLLLKQQDKESLTLNPSLIFVLKLLFKEQQQFGKDTNILLLLLKGILASQSHLDQIVFAFQFAEAFRSSNLPFEHLETLLGQLELSGSFFEQQVLDSFFLISSSSIGDSSSDSSRFGRVSQELQKRTKSSIIMASPPIYPADIIRNFGYPAMSSVDVLLEVLSSISIIPGKRMLSVADVADILEVMCLTVTGLVTTPSTLSSLQFIAPSYNPQAPLPQSWNFRVFVSVMQKLCVNVSWDDVIRSLGRPNVLATPNTLSIQGFQLLISVHNWATQHSPLTGELFLHTEWDTALAAQAAWLQYVHRIPSEALYFTPTEVTLPGMSPLVTAGPFASAHLVQALLRLAEYGFDSTVRVPLEAARKTCPDYLLLSSLRSGPPSLRLREELITALVATLVTRQPLSREVLIRAWSIDRESVVKGLLSAHTMHIVPLACITDFIREIPESLSLLLQISDPITALDIACAASQINDPPLLPLEKWLDDRFMRTQQVSNEATIRLATRLIEFLQIRVISPEASMKSNPALTPDVVTTFFKVLQNVSSVLPPEFLSMLESTREQCMRKLSTLRGSSTLVAPMNNSSGNPSSSLSTNPSPIPPPTGGGGATNPGPINDDVEKLANSYFKEIYTEQRSIEEVVIMLNNFKNSPDPRERDIFACMIRNLFEEYRFFHRYPDKELRITGVLFGNLIQHRLVAGMTLAIALRYVLEALRRVPDSVPNQKLFRFGMFALREFKSRLLEWPQLCVHVTSIQHLHENHPALMEEINSIVANSAAAGSPGMQANSLPAAVGGPPNSVTQTPIAGYPPPAPVSRYQNPIGHDEEGSLASQIARVGLGISPSLSAQSSISNTSTISNTSSSSGSMSSSSSSSNSNSGSNSGIITEPPRSPGLQAQYQSLSAAGLVHEDFGASNSLPLRSTENPEAYEQFCVKLDTVIEAPPDSQEVPSPGDQIEDHLHFVINNLTKRNMEEKVGQARQVLSQNPNCLKWVANYLVVKRVSTQQNFHDVYMEFLDKLGDKRLMLEIRLRTLVNVRKLLRSNKIVTSTTERSLLKNLGSWLGQLTLAKNKPLLQREVDLKELLYDGYERGWLIAIVPFAAKILDGIRASKIFLPPNPWVMGIIRTLAELYHLPELKLNLKFEIEMLCKHIGLDLSEVEPSSTLHLRLKPRLQHNPDFNIKGAANIMTGLGGNNSPILNPVPPVASGINANVNMPNTAQNMGGVSAPPGGLVSTMVDHDNMLGGYPPSSSSTPTIPAGGVPTHIGSTNGSVINVGGGGNPDMMPIQPTSGGGGVPMPSSSGPGSSHQMTPINPANTTTRIPNLAAYVKISGGLQLFVQQPDLKSVVPVAVDRAIREIIQPVVERSVTISCLTTRELIVKDFAMEPDEKKMLKAAHLMVSHLAGALALVTCKDPLRVSMGNHLRVLLGQFANIDPVVIDQVVQVCSAENLELGCMLIEKAATEKAMRDIDEALESSVALRRESRERNGEPYVDASIFKTGTRYPSSLPDMLIPKPNKPGLSPEQLIVYESFQRMPRQPVAPPRSQTVTGAQQPPISQSQQQQPVSSGSTFASRSNDFVEPLRNLITRLELDLANNTPEILLLYIPDIVSLRNVIPPNIREEAFFPIAQRVLKRMYETPATDKARLDACVALLEAIGGAQELKGKITELLMYAPSNQKLNRIVALCLINARMVVLPEFDAYLVKLMDGGRHAMSVAFATDLIQHCVLGLGTWPVEQCIQTLDTLQKVRKLLSPETAQSLTRLLAEVRALAPGVIMPSDTGATHTSSSSIIPPPTSGPNSTTSTTSSSNISTNVGGGKIMEDIGMYFRSTEDAPALRTQVAQLLQQWMVVSSENRPVEPFLVLLQHRGILRGEQNIQRFFRICIEFSLESYLTIMQIRDASKWQHRYSLMDATSSLLTTFISLSPDPQTKAIILAKQLETLTTVLLRDCLSRRENGVEASAGFDQRPYFRFLLFVQQEVDQSSLIVFAELYRRTLSPSRVPEFAFSWLELVSHSSLMPKLLKMSEPSGWHAMQTLLVVFFDFMHPFLREARLSPASRVLYKGTLRVLLVLLHDYPEFLCSYHTTLCDVVPVTCVQLRNLICSAFPGSMRLPDPFTPNLKLDMLQDISRSPRILGNYTAALESSGLLPELNNYLEHGNRNFLKSLPGALFLSSGTYNISLVSSLVLYCGIYAINAAENGKVQQTNANNAADDESISGSRAPLALSVVYPRELFQFLVTELDSDGRYLLLNAIANQLRFPNSHTHYFSCINLLLFKNASSEVIKEQITRVLLERLVVHRPHPWGLLVTFIELIKNPRYAFWSHGFTKSTAEIEKVFQSVASSCMPQQQVPGKVEG